MNYGRTNTSRRRLKLQSKNAKKKRQSKRGFLKTCLLVFLGLGIVGLIGGGLLFKSIIDKAPEITDDTLKPSAYITTVFANDGTTEIGTFVNAGSNRVYRKLDAIPQDLQDAFVAIEDSRFQEHNGIDLKGIMRAAFTGITSGSLSQGGSTITQQLVKNITKDDESKGLAGIFRKVKEWAKAYQVERMVSKDQILELYLNILYVGGEGNLHGVELGAEYYFNKSAKDLDLAECAFMAGINHSPSRYNPFDESLDNDEIIKNIKHINK